MKNQDQPAYPIENVKEFDATCLTKLERACLDLAPAMIAKHIDPGATDWDYNWIAAETKRAAIALLAELDRENYCGRKIKEVK